ncbi:MAG: FtsX-like permease family protein [Bacilli bacterium]|nr:FtsX-like permease family protein [Bacilli bacterium]
MLFKKLLRTIWHYKAQFISMIIMVLLGIGVFVGFQGEWYSIEKDTYSFYNSTGFADYRLVSETGYSLEEMNKISEIEGVSKASRYISIKTNESKENDVVAVTITTDYEVSGFKVIDGEQYDKNALDAIWISDQYANKNNYKLNDNITLKYGSISITGQIKGLIKSSEYLICTPDENQMMPDFNTYGYVYISPAMYKSVLGGFEFYSEIHAISSLSKKEFSDSANEKLGKTNLILTKNEIISFSEAQGEATEGKTMASILPVVFLGIAVLIMATTMQRLTINEKTQIGTLKALGFRDAKIVKHYTLFGLFIGVVGSILGIGFGYFIAWFIFNPNGSMGTYFDLPDWGIHMPWWTFLVVIAVILFMTLISYISAKNMLKGTASDALKPYTPKAMKRLKIEDSKSWRKLKFATKWNLRDLFRHKARSGMTLFGVFGCTILLIASFLMMDSMVGFVNKFYYGSLNYESQISLKEETTNEKALEIVSYYEADYAASTNVSLNEEAIAMDIYDVSHNYVRFLDKDMNYASLKDDGVYIGQRLIESNHLKIGDEFEVAVFGSDIKYTLKLAGELRTLTKSVIMSENYAKEKGINYKINQIYTNKNKADINKDTIYSDYISIVKSRNDIIKSFDSFMEVMYVMIGALIVLSIILGVVVLYNLGTMSYFERYRELSTLKVVGFKDKKIGKLLITQNMWLTIIGFLIGFPSGIGVTYILVKALASEYEMKLIFGWMTFVIPIILVFGVSLLVSWLVSKKNKKINMVEALKVPE